MTSRNPREVPAWPAAATDTELSKAQIAEVAKRRGQFDEADHESRTAIETAQIDILKGSIERSRDSAKTVQTAATAIAGLYTGLAGLVFSVGDDKPLPLRGVIPVVFLGAAIVAATSFLAWLGDTGAIRPFPVGVDAGQLRAERVAWLRDWVSLGLLRKAWRLRLGTLCLAAGLVFLPAPLIPIRATTSAPKPAATTATKPDWPAVPDDDHGVSRIKYQAEVDEIAKERTDAATASTGGAVSGARLPEWTIWVAAALVALAIAVSVGFQHLYGSVRKGIDLAIAAGSGGGPVTVARDR